MNEIKQRVKYRVAILSSFFFGFVDAMHYQKWSALFVTIGFSVLLSFMIGFASFYFKGNYKKDLAN